MCVYACQCEFSPYVGACGDQKKVGIPWSWSHRQLSAASCGCWALNLGGLQEQQASYLVNPLFSAHTDTTNFNF